MPIVTYQNVGAVTTTPAADNAYDLGTTTGPLRWRNGVLVALELADGSGNATSIVGAASITSYTVTMPAAQGGANTVLLNNGSGTLTWTAQGALGVLWNSVNAPTGNQGLAMGAFTTTWTWGTATTQTGLTLTSTSITTGGLAAMSLTGASAIATPAGSGSILTLTSTATGYTAATQSLAAITSSGANTNASVIMTGLTISVTNTGTTNTNTALTLTASGGSTANNALNITAGQIIVPNGTSPLPSYSFNSDRTMGMYYFGANAIGFALGSSNNIAMHVDQSWTNVGTIMALTTRIVGTDNGTTFNIGTNQVARWSLSASSNTLTSFGASTIATSTGNLTFAAAGVAGAVLDATPVFYATTLQIGGTLGTAATANQISTGSLGGSSTPLYIGNAQIITGSVTILGTIATYAGVATAGTGLAVVRAEARLTGLTAASGTVATFTPAADASFIVSANVVATSNTTSAFTVTVSYTSEDNIARVLTLSFSTLAGTITTTIGSPVTAPYEGVPFHIRVKAATAITIQSAAGGTYTSVTYNIEAAILQIA